MTGSMGRYEHYGTRQEQGTLLLNGPGIGWLLAGLFPQHSSPNQHAASNSVTRDTSFLRSDGDTRA